MGFSKTATNINATAILYGKNMRIMKIMKIKMTIEHEEMIILGWCVDPTLFVSLERPKSQKGFVMQSLS